MPDETVPGPSDLIKVALVLRAWIVAHEEEKPATAALFQAAAERCEEEARAKPKSDYDDDGNFIGTNFN